jgi:hypothetical protein
MKTLPTNTTKPNLQLLSDSLAYLNLSCYTYDFAREFTAPSSMSCTYEEITPVLGILG